MMKKYWICFHALPIFPCLCDDEQIFALFHALLTFPCEEKKRKIDKQIFDLFLDRYPAHPGADQPGTKPARH